MILHALNQFITIGAIVVFVVQLIFVVNFFYSIWKGKKVKSKNPWGATTLEWTTPIRPGTWKLAWENTYCVSDGLMTIIKTKENLCPQIVPVAEGEEEH